MCFSVGRVDGNWNSMVEAPNAVEKWDTGVNIDLLRFIGAKSINLNSSFVRFSIFNFLWMRLLTAEDE